MFLSISPADGGKSLGRSHRRRAKKTSANHAGWSLHRCQANQINRSYQTKPAFKPVFQVAVTKEGSDIRIINELLNGTSVFLVETGETLCVPQTRFIIEQFNGYRSSLVSALI